MRYVIFLALLAGCATPEQEIEAEREAYRNAVHSQCRNYGFAPGSPQYSDCLMRVDMAYRQMLIQQELQEESAARARSLPYCASLPPGLAGAYRARGACR